MYRKALTLAAVLALGAMATGCASTASNPHPFFGTMDDWHKNHPAEQICQDKHVRLHVGAATQNVTLPACQVNEVKTQAEKAAEPSF